MKVEDSIPKEIWSHPLYFDTIYTKSSIAKKIENVINNSSSDSTAALTAIMSIPDFRSWDTQQKSCLWLALAFCYPELSDPLLCIFIGLLCLDLDVGFQLAALLGRTSFWECFCRDNPTALKEQDYVQILAHAKIRTENPLVPIIEKLAIENAPKPIRGKSIFSSEKGSDADSRACLQFNPAANVPQLVPERSTQNRILTYCF